MMSLVIQKAGKGNDIFEYTSGKDITIVCFNLSLSYGLEIQEAVERTFLSNLVSVQSDCPAREKFGYGGDINATSESYIYNFDMHSIK